MISIARKTFLDALGVVSEALNKSDTLPMMQDFCFRNNQVSAFNEAMTMVTPLESGLSGGVLGNVLLQLLESSRARDIIFEEDGESLNMRVGRARLTLALRPADPYPKLRNFDVNRSRVVTLPKSIHTALEALKLSYGNDIATPDQLGVTYIENESVVNLYTTNNKSISHARLPIDSSTPSNNLRTILPQRFVAAVAKRSVGKQIKLSFHGAHVIYEDESGKIIGNLLQPDRPLDIEQAVQAYVPAQLKQRLEALPKALPAILKRACILITDATTHSTTMVVKDNACTFLTQTALGEAQEVVALSKHPNMKTKFDAGLLEEACKSDLYTHVVFDPRCVWLTNEHNNINYIMATRG